jgi:hypothetical protein
MDYSSLFEINLHRLEDNIKEKLYELLLPIFKKKQYIENDLTERRSIIEKYMKITYREEGIHNQLKNVKTEEAQEREDKIIKEMVHEAKIDRTKKTNEFTSFKLVTNKKKLNTKSYSTAEVPVSLSFNKIYNYKQRPSLFTTELSERKRNSQFSSIDYRQPTMHTTILETEKNIYKQTTFEERIPLRGKLGAQKFSLFKSFISKIIKDMDEKLTINKVILSKKIKKNITDWKNLSRNKGFKYSTGSIELPLLTQLKSNN